MYVNFKFYVNFMSIWIFGMSNNVKVAEDEKNISKYNNLARFIASVNDTKKA